MLVGFKDAVKLIGVSIMTACAVLVCTMFLNFYFDLIRIESEISSETAMLFYNAQVSTIKVVCLVSGGCLLVTSLIMLIFYIKHYIDVRHKELGILKALGYSNIKIAKSFWVFGLSAFIGTSVGFAAAFALMPRFYELQNKDNIFPNITINFHPSILLYFVIIPTAAFSFIAVFYAFSRLKRPVLLLIKDNYEIENQKKKQIRDKDSSAPFLADLRRNVLKTKKILVFFIVFASFCFSSMTQMSFSMKDLSSEMMGAMMLIIGLVLAFTSLFLAVTTVINGNKKTIAIMNAFGYSFQECSRAIMGVYRPLSYIGFVIGTLYQYALLRVMVDIVFKDVEGVPEYKFNFSMMLVSLAVFAVAYEVLMYIFSNKIKKISIKNIMLS